MHLTWFLCLIPNFRSRFSHFLKVVIISGLTHLRYLIINPRITCRATFMFPFPQCRLFSQPLNPSDVFFLRQWESENEWDNTHASMSSYRKMWYNFWINFPLTVAFFQFTHFRYVCKKASWCIVKRGSGVQVKEVFGRFGSWYFAYCNERVFVCLCGSFFAMHFLGRPDNRLLWM